MTRAVMRFSGGKDSVLAALRVGPVCESLDLLTFSTRMIANVAASRVNAERIKQMLGPTTRVTHEIIDIDATVRFLFQPRGWRDNWKRYGSYAVCCMCNGCDLAMIVHTILHGAQHGLGLAFDGGNHAEFAGFLDEWALPKIQAFSAEFGVRWEFPVWEEERADLGMLELGFQANPPQLLYRSQPHCRGGGPATNVYMRCYYLPRYGRDGYRETTLRWLDDRLALAREFIRSRLGEGGADAPPTVGRCACGA